MKQLHKQTIQTKNGIIEYSLSKNGSPTVVLMNGGSGPIEGWYKVFHELAKETTVIAYNRSGIGKSDKPTSPQDGNAIVKALRELLHVVQLKPPYILVGHSLGGLYTNLFARQHPDEVVGVVLLDASHPKDLKIDQLQGKFIRTTNRLLRFFDSLSKHYIWNEIHYVEETARQIEQAGTFPNVPLLIVSGGKKPPMISEVAYQIRSDNQLDYTRLSEQGKHIIATKSGHFPQFTEPDLVIQSVFECIRLSRLPSDS